MPSFSFWVFAVSNFTQKEQLFFLFMIVLRQFWWICSSNSSKQRQIELKFWPQRVLIVIQMAFKEFWKSRFCTETERTRNLSFWSNFDCNILPEDGQTQKYLLGYPDESKSRPYIHSILNENYNSLMPYLGLFGYKRA